MDFLNWGEIHKPSDIDEITTKYLLPVERIKTNKKITYYNAPCAFDIETTSFFRSTGNVVEKAAITYEWTLGVNGAVIIGRTWLEFLETLNKIIVLLNLWDENRLIIYVHNLSYEFQFMRKWFEWKNVFAIDNRKPVYALTANGIEFRCSYLLSGYSLEKLSDQLHKYPVKKMSGDLDYKLIRHWKTPLTEKELKYCEHDVRVPMAYIQEQIEEYGNITKLPLTKTGFVRNYCRNSCMYDGSHKKNSIKYLKYRKLMDSLTVSPDEYRQLKRAFQGGFTHASAWKSGKILYNVGSFDFTSSYPAVMVAEKFPMSAAELIHITSATQFYDNLNTYCCLFDVELWGLESTTLIEHPLSVSRCSKTVKPIIDNGRVVAAEHLCTTLTEQDYFILEKFYKWENISIGNFRRYKRDYLPTDFVKSILKLYQDKTMLKGVDGKEIEYLKSKEMINACYGMTVTDICRDENIYDTEWTEIKANIENALMKYNRAKRRFLFYPWGVWVTAYARKNLFSGIYAFNTDYVYSDTDSVKAVNVDNHIDYINAYNKMITDKLQKAMEYHNLPFEMCNPKTIKGIEKPLGVWDFEGTYTRFKTLGAKRYMVEKDGKIDITVSGLNKKICVPYLLEKYGNNVFEEFSDELYIPPEYTGKNTHTYIDDDIRGVITDYLGNVCEYEEKSGIHLSAADYSLSLSREYADYLLGIKTYEN